MNLTRALPAIFVALQIAAIVPAFAQPAGSGFEDQGSIPVPQSKREAYGVNSPVEGEQAISGAAETFTRHRRFGRSTGIGASTAQTTATTIEAFPAVSGNTSAVQGSTRIPALSQGALFRSLGRGPTFSESMEAGAGSALTPALSGTSTIEGVDLTKSVVRGQKPFSFIESPTGSLSGLGRGASIITNP